MPNASKPRVKFDALEYGFGNLARSNITRNVHKRRGLLVNVRTKV